MSSIELELKLEIKPETIVFVAAHSGGHIIPAITMAKKIINKSLLDRKFLITSNQILDKKIIAKNAPQLNCFYLDLPHTPYYNSKNNLFDKIYNFTIWSFKCLKTFVQSLFIFLKIGQCKVVSTGGVISIPVCLAAKILQRPIELYELNVTPGKSTKLLAKLVDKIFVNYKQTANLIKHKNIEKVNYPIKWPKYQKLDNNELQDFKKKYGNYNKVILITGGSQGAVSLNYLVINWLKKCDLKDFIIIHQAGSNKEELIEFYKNNLINAYVFDFIDDLEPFYKIADFIITRAGAGAIAEGLWSNAKLIIVPLKKIAGNHQYENALAALSENPSRITIFDEEIKNQDLFLKDFLEYQALQIDQKN